jgi:hypothetical protein
MKKLLALLALLAAPVLAQHITATTPGGFQFRSTDTANILTQKLEIVRKTVAAGGGGGVSSFNTRTGAVTLTSGDVTTALTFTPLRPSNNLSDVSSAATSRTNLGLGTAATFSSSSFLQAANNLSDLASASTARTNLGLGTAATSASTDFAAAVHGHVVGDITVSANNRLLGRYGGAVGPGQEIALGTPFTVASGTLVLNLLGGDVTNSSGGQALTIGSNTVTYAKMQDVSATSRFIGRITAGAGDPEELTGTQATTLLDTFTSALKGLAPASGGGTTNFLRADGAWAAPGGGGGTTTNALTMNNGGSGAASGSTFNGSAAVTLSYNTLGAAPLASPTFTGKVTTAASATGGAGLNLPHGAAPSSPANGDVWTTTSGIFWRINGATVQNATGGGTATGTNTGDQTITLTGDVTGSGTGSFAATLATVNSNTGTFGSSSAIPVITVNGKGLITAVSTASPSGGSSWTELTLASDFTNSTATQNTVSDGTTILGFTPTSGATYEAEATLLIETATATVLPMVGVTVNAPGTGGYGSARIEAVGATVTSVVEQALTWTNVTASTNLPAGGLPAASTSYIVKVWIRGHNGTNTNAINITCSSETAGTTVKVRAGSQLRYKLT